MRWTTMILGILFSLVTFFILGLSSFNVSNTSNADQTGITVLFGLIALVVGIIASVLVALKKKAAIWLFIISALSVVIGATNLFLVNSDNASATALQKFFPYIGTLFFILCAWLARTATKSK